MVGGFATTHTLNFLEGRAKGEGFDLPPRSPHLNFMGGFAPQTPLDNPGQARAQAWAWTMLGA